jgi:protease IV
MLNKENFNFIIKSFIIAFFSLLVGVLLLFWSFSLFGNIPPNPEVVNRNTFLDNQACNIAVIPINGTIVQSAGQMGTTTEETFTDAGQIILKLKDAEDSINIQAVLLEINSPGGYGGAPDFILNALDNFNKRKVAQIYDFAYSGGYWVALGAEKIFAQKTSDIGSIGVTSSFVNNAKSLENKGEKYIDISTGEYKTIGDPAKPISEKEIDFLKNKLQKTENVFIEEVASHRNLSKEKVEKLATGETWIASEAKDLGLIDEVGYTKEVNLYLQNILGLEKKEDLVFCY